LSTDTEGRYRLTFGPKDGPFVFITTPSGYRCSSDFYRRITAGKDMTADFGLVSDPASGASTFSFSQIPDIHIGRDKETSLSTFIEDLGEINRLDSSVAFIVATGDLVHDGGAPGTYDEYLKGVKTWPKRYYHVIGNHDGTPNYEPHLGPSSYSFDYGPVHFVVFNCLEPDRYMSWLKKDLDRQPKGKIIIGAQHVQPDKRLLDIFSAYNTRAFIYGHWHSNKTFYYGKILVVSTPTFRFGGIDCSSRGYRVLTVKDGQVQTQYRWGGFEGLPKKKEGVVAGDLYSLSWKTQIKEGSGITDPLVADGRVYVGVQDDNNVRDSGILCLDSRDGKQIWKAKTDSTINGKPVLSGGIVCAVSVIGTVYGFDAVSGQMRWTNSLGLFCDRWVYSSPVLDKAGKRVFCGTGPYFACFDLMTGKKIWQAPSLGVDWISCRANPIADESAVYLHVNWTGGLEAVSQADGAMIWNLKVNEGFSTTHSTPVVQDQTLYALADNLLYSLDKKTGKKKWQVKIDGGWTASSPAVKGSTLVVGTPDGKVLAMETATGKTIWSFKTGPSIGTFSPYIRNGSQVMSAVVISEDRVYVGANDGAFYVLELATGKVLWQYQVNAPIFAGSTVTNDRLYFSDCKGTIYSFAKKGK